MSRTRTVLLVWLAISCWSGALHLRATLDPPAGRTFAGTFHWIDDFYHYLSYVQQAEDGHLLFHNKLAPPAPARLFNLEWWLVGTASRWLGGRPFAAYALLNAVATLALVAGAERWLSCLGVPLSHRFAALFLTSFGGGLGGLLFELTDLPVDRCLDLLIGLFPFLETVANPHFVAGTALLLWSLWFFSEVPAPRGPLLGVLTGSVLVLVRPYEVALLIGMRSAAVVTLEPRGRWLRSLAPLLGLTPVVAYDLWALYGPGQFAMFNGPAFPRPFDFAAALGPAALLAAAEWRRPAKDGAHRRARLQLWAWAAAALVLVVTRPGGFMLQLLVGAGLPLLLLGAAALSELDARATALAALCLGASAVVETRVLLADDPNWFVPEERLAAARALRGLCHSGDRLLAPPDVSLFAIGLSSCDAFVAHSAARDYEARLARTRAFYGDMAPAARQAFLDAERVTHLVLPGWLGPVPAAWLGPDTAFHAAKVIGTRQPVLSIYVRPRDTASPP